MYCGVSNHLYWQWSTTNVRVAVADTCSSTSAPVSNGCTDSTATNYDPTATVDDGSCVYPSHKLIYLLLGMILLVDYTVLDFGGIIQL